MEERNSQELTSRPQNGPKSGVSDIREKLKPEDLEIYNMFTHSSGGHTLHNLRQARHKHALLQALKNNKGFVAKACEEVGISRRTYYSYVADDPLFAEMVMEIREEIVDIVENQLVVNAEKGYEASIIFFLKTQGKRRGYGDQNQIGSFGGTQEEYYKDRYRDMDDASLVEEIRSLRERLKIDPNAAIGGYDETGEELLLGENSVIQEEEPRMKDEIINKDEVGVISSEQKDIDLLLEESMGHTAKEMEREIHDYQRTLRDDKNPDFRDLIGGIQTNGDQ